MKAELKCAFSATLGLICDLVKAREEDFFSVFPFGVWLLPKSQWFNQQPAKLASVGRLWSYTGLVVWFRTMWTWRAEKNHLFWPSFLLYASCKHVLSAFEGGLKAGGLLCLFLCLLYMLCQTTMCWEEQSLCCFDNMTDLVTAVLSPPLPLCTDVFLFTHNQILSLTSAAVHDALSSET